ncbi:hypothetical protein WP5W18E06_P10110 (plasmid) [Klebsiella quasipneumoniae]|nr:hypothetical protein WP5W18E06_P10110 [Klebsiella quasipneumoniae]
MISLSPPTICNSADKFITTDYLQQCHNLHIHIAINKIHPTRHTIHEPYYPHRTLADLCEVLERDYNLERDNHQPRQRGAAARAADMEQHAGVESLVGWIKRECLEEIRSAASWAELHQVMQSNGLELRARGNGLVIAAGDGTTIKASTLARDLSKPALEKRLGTFEATAERQAQQAQRSYQKKPLRMRVDTTELYARYQSEQKGLSAARAEALAEAKRRKDRAVEDAKRKAATKRAAIKLATGGVTKRLLYSQTSARLRNDLEAIRKQYDQERTKLYQGFQRRQWADWLKQEAMNGDSQALDALRAREAAQGLKGDTLTGQGKAKPGHAPVIDNITKKGTIIYRAGKTAVRDDGNRLQVSCGAGGDGVQVALRMAMERYGECLTVNGSPEFKAAVIRAAVDSKMPITFADPGLEKRRQALIEKARRPGVPPVGHEPPPHRRNGLRNLSQVEGLRIEGEAVQKPAPAPTQKPAGVSEQEQRKAKLRAEMEAKKARRQGKGRGR